jgi:hypothetical protein
VLYTQNFIHALQAKASFPVQKVADVSLLEPGLCGQAQAGQFAVINAMP